MEVIHPYCAGLDVQKKAVLACCMTSSSKGERVSQTHSFNNQVLDLLALSDWLGSNSVTHIALDITGEDWKTTYHILEANFSVLVVNAQRIKDVPGRDRNTPDVEWLAELLRHGLIRNSFIHPVPQRDLRDLMRQRHFLVKERLNVVDRLYKVLESANVKLVSMVSDIMQISARALLVAIAEGETTTSDVTIASSVRQQHSQDAYFRPVRSHHRFLIANHLNHIDFLDQQIGLFSDKITEYVQKRIIRTTTPSSDRVQPSTPATATSVQTAKLIPSWEEALAAFLNGGRI
jgi:transposase